MGPGDQRRRGEPAESAEHLAAAAGEDDWRIDHTGIGVSDISRSVRFYNAALGALNMRVTAQITKTFEPAASDSDDLGGVAYGEAYPVFWIDCFHPHSVRQHTAFAATNRAQVEAFHAAALKAGGTDNGTPGLRRPNYYAAFVFDPDGNNMEAVFRGD